MSKPVIFVQGTTASGKSDLALSLAEEFSGHVVNCDSVQVYKYLNVGSAMPSKSDFARAPHHLFGYIEPPKEMTAGTYCDDFFAKITEINAPIFVVGGTGFYFQAIEKGMYPVRKVSKELKEQIEGELETEDGVAKLYQELQKVDPESAKKIHPNDAYRIGRAIEVFRSEGKPLSQIVETQVNKGPRLERVLKIGMQWEKSELVDRILLRTKKMLANGIIEETKAVLDQGWKDWAPIRSVGYKEVVDYLEGTIKSINELETQIATHTNQLAKKQRTWFQRDLEINWCNPMAEKHKISQLVSSFLENT